MNREVNCISHWFPKLQAAGVPVPRTELVHTDEDLDLNFLLEGETPDGWDEFIAELKAAVERIGGPQVFLRTGQTSGKHEWSRTCFLEVGKGSIEHHVGALVEWSALVDMLGLPTNVWAVREFLPTTPIITCPAYHGFPVCREFRAFVQDGKVQCVHPYWPRKSLEEGFPNKPIRCEKKPNEDTFLALEDSERDLPADFDQMYERLCDLGTEDRIQVFALARKAGAALGGYWSVDLLETQRGWYVTDCATGKESFHWPECGNATKWR